MERDGEGWFKRQFELGNIVLIVTFLFMAGTVYQRLSALEQQVAEAREEQKARIEAATNQAADARDQAKMLNYQIIFLSEQVKKLTEELKDLRRDATGRFR